jgi:hypothetical protein
VSKKVAKNRAHLTRSDVEIAQAFEKHGIDIPVFEYNRPTIQNLNLTTIPSSKPTHLEEGRKVIVSAVIHESGYGLDPNSVRLEINGKEYSLGNSLTLQAGGKRARLRYSVKNGEPVHSRDFGAILTARLFARDWAGNENQEKVTKPLKDTIKPKYELANLNRQGQYLEVAVRVTDEGSGINPASIVARVDGKNVTGIKKEKISDYEYLLSIKYPCNPPPQVLYAEISDRAGNVVSQTQPVTGPCWSPCAFSGAAVFLAMAMMHYRRRRDS